MLQIRLILRMPFPKKTARGLAISSALLALTALTVVVAWVNADSGSRSLPPLQPAKRRPPDPAKPPRLSESDVEEVLARILTHLREEYVARLTNPRSRCGVLDSWLSEDRRSHRPLARLFARAFPELAKRRTLEIFEDPEATITDRGFALLMLGELRDWTTDRLEQWLRSQTMAADESYNYFPLYELGLRDRDLRHRDLYQDECRRGNRAAFEVLSGTFHPSSVALFEELSKQTREIHWPLGSIPTNAIEALGRLEILQSSRWREEVERMLRVPGGGEFGSEDWSNFAWAYRVARQRSLPTLLDCLAERARRDTGGDREERDIKDYALWRLAELGGELTPFEFNRLRPNGFVGNAEERLMEMLVEERIH